MLSAPSSDWPTSFDQTAVSDDDLGFDPFIESNKGLADMLENENGHRMSPLVGYRGSGLGLPAVHHHRPPPGVAARHNIMTVGGDMISAGIMSSIVTPSSPSVLPSSAVCSNASTLPPPPGLPAFPHYGNDGSAVGLPSSSTTPPLAATTGPGTTRFHFIFFFVVPLDCTVLYPSLCFVVVIVYFIYSVVIS